MMICESISQQPYKDFFEVVLVDDSDPQYERYVSKCFDLLSRAGVKVKKLRGSGAGVGDAMFIGLKASKGKYVFFLDADNILTHNFMASVINYLKEGAFVSFLSRSVISRRIPALFYAEQLRALIRRGLRFDWKYGFVNILYIWRKDILSCNARIMNPKISLLDQIDLRSLINQHVIKCKKHVHIRDILVMDIRHTIEDFGLRFMYRRLNWYYSSQGSLKEMLKLRDVRLALLLPIILAVILVPLILIGFIHILYALILYTLLLITTAGIKTMKPLLQVIIGIIWLPMLLITKSILTYIIIFKRLAIKLYYII